MNLKRALILPLATSLLLGGCETDVPPDPNASNAATKFQQGLRGRGQLTQPDRSDDPAIRENTRVGY